MRVAGMVSGMDIDHMVKELMQVERQPIDKLEQQVMTREWQVEAYREVNTEFDAFRTELFDTVMRTSNMTVQSVESSDDNRVTAEVRGAHSNMNYTVNEVEQLAQEASTFSNKTLTDGSSLDPSEALHSEVSSDVWKEGIIHRETVQGEGENIVDVSGDHWNEKDLNKLDITVGEESFQVVTDDTDLNDEQVYAHISDDGELQLTFARDISADQSVHIEGIQQKAVEAFDAGEPRSEFELSRGNISEDSIEVKVEGEDPLKVVTDPTHTLKEGEVFVDLESGELILAEETDQQVTVEYKEQYLAGRVTTFAENGDPQTEQMIVSADDTLDDIIERLNESELGVQSFYDPYSDRLSVTRTETGTFHGAGEDIQFEGELFEDLLGLQHADIHEEDGEFVIRDGSGTKLDWAFADDRDNEDLEGVTFDRSLAEESGGAYAGVLSNEDGEVVTNKEIVVDGQVVARTDDAGRLTYDGLQGAQNARFTVNGLETERPSNSFDLGDMSLTLHETFSRDEASVRLESDVDTDSIFETIEGFVERYNEILDDVNGRLQEERYRDYPPLTDEQRHAMSEREIDLWEEKAMSGMLRNDSTIRSTMVQMRVDLYTLIDSEGSEFNSLASIGITTTRDYLERGKLEINEDALREAIEKDPSSVHQVFAANGDTNAEKGVAVRLRETLDAGIENLSLRAGGMRGRSQDHQFALGRQMNNLEDRIEQAERRLSQVEDRYWSQFGAMEQAMAQAQQQSNMLFSQMFGM
ncbi:flagellar filament capping protein FliD [Texcoconibacillus texcoconensis]|uniref:Flagellar hook-associated protein 2 n=1 Tax=Texcoconibacillus texcoconensis TaxID=1095777 RepID=A0A840QPV4_9BACI|nr:flagellar filament capping protein FliD [Texcoconibacillus texcoconensis]MBB5173405.1 flagellar hook-associated protein 2 [Texcoconibacillus texcoconensis]